MEGNEERNKQIVDYLNQKMDEIDKEYPQLNVRTRATRALDKVLESKGSFEEIKGKLDNTLNKMISEYKEKIKEKEEEEKASRSAFDKAMEGNIIATSSEYYFGQTYSTPLIEVFEKYEEIKNSSLTDEEKKNKFNDEYKVLLSVLKQKYRASISSQIKDDIMRGEFNGKKEDPLLYIMTGLFRGFDSLNYDIVSKLYNIFVNDINVVSTDFDNDMKFCINGSEAVYVLPDNTYYPNENYFDFSRLMRLFKFAKKHNKKIRLHSLFSNILIPEAFVAAVKKLPDDKIFEFGSAFLSDYLKNLSDALKKENIVLDQIDVFSNLTEEENFWFKTVDATDNGYDYYVDILKLTRTFFPDTKLIVNVDNECLDYVCASFCKIVQRIRAVERNESIKLIDGIGLSSHITEFLEYYGRELKGKDLYDTMLQYVKLDLPIYRTEFDYKAMDDSNKKEILDIIQYIDGKCGVRGFVLCGNNDLLTTKSGEFNNVSMIDKDGNPKEEYVSFKKKYTKRVDNQPEILTFTEDENPGGNPTVIKYSTDNKGAVSAVFMLGIMMIVLVALIVAAFMLIN